MTRRAFVWFGCVSLIACGCRVERGRGWRLGRVSHLLTPSYGFCGRCRTTWYFVKEHVTMYSTGGGMFALCEKCWAELTPDTRLPFYRRLYAEWEESGRRGLGTTDGRPYEPSARWETIEAAVRAGR